MIAEGKHLRVVFSQIFQSSRGSCHPPHVLLRSTNLRQVELHVIVVIVVNQQIVVATGGNQTIVFLAVLEDNTLVGNSFKIREREDETLQVLHLVEAWIFQSLIPCLHITRITIACRIARL